MQQRSDFGMGAKGVTALVVAPVVLVGAAALFILAPKRAGQVPKATASTQSSVPTTVPQVQSRKQASPPTVRATPPASPIQSVKKTPLYRGQPARHWVEVLEDRDFKTRREAALALAEIGADGVTTDLVPALRRTFKGDTDEFVQVRTALVLWEVARDAEALRFLVEFVGIDGDPEHIAACTDAARALGRIGPPAKAALPTLHRLAQYGHEGTMLNRYPEVRALGYAARDAMARIGRYDPPPEQTVDHFRDL